MSNILLLRSVPFAEPQISNEIMRPYYLYVVQTVHMFLRPCILPTAHQHGGFTSGFRTQGSFHAISATQSCS